MRGEGGSVGWRLEPNDRVGTLRGEERGGGWWGGGIRAGGGGKVDGGGHGSNEWGVGRSIVHGAR